MRAGWSGNDGVPEIGLVDRAPVPCWVIERHPDGTVAVQVASGEVRAEVGAHWIGDSERNPQRLNESRALRDDQRGLQDADSSLQMASTAFAYDGGGMLLSAACKRAFAAATDPVAKTDIRILQPPRTDLDILT